MCLTYCCVQCAQLQRQLDAAQHDTEHKHPYNAAARLKELDDDYELSDQGTTVEDWQAKCASLEHTVVRLTHDLERAQALTSEDCKQQVSS